MSYLRGDARRMSSHDGIQSVERNHWEEDDSAAQTIGAFTRGRLALSS
jgi:hypothetical protein